MSPPTTNRISVDTQTARKKWIRTLVQGAPTIPVSMVWWYPSIPPSRCDPLKVCVMITVEVSKSLRVYKACVCVCVCVCVCARAHVLTRTHSVISGSLWPHRLWPARLLCSWDFLGESTGVGCHALLQGIFPSQGLNLHLLCFLH